MIPLNAFALIPFGKVIDTEWLAQKTLKYGMVASLCTAQVTNGLLESYKFNGRHIVSESNYHVIRTVHDISYIGSGWFMYANVRDANLSWFGKTRRIIGSAMLARNCFEWVYKANRWGNPLDYSETHSNNRKALVYFTLVDGKLVDMYISGTGVQGVLIDMLFLVGGLIVFK